jgi:hypothetical protein
MHRKLLDNPIVCKDSDHLAVWTYILLNASHKEYPAVFGKEKIMLKPGQLITGRKSISDKLRVSESKIQRILSCFESEHQIEQQTGNKNRLITVLSWIDYQDSEQQDELEMNNKRTTDEQQVNTNKKLRTKELKNKEPKREYVDYVFLTETEYDKLTNLLGESERERYFLRFASWISGQTKRVQESRSAYLTIMNWHRDSPKKNNVTPFKPSEKKEKEVELYFRQASGDDSN